MNQQRRLTTLLALPVLSAMLVTALLCAAPPTRAQAQPAQGVPRIGVLDPASTETSAVRLAAQSALSVPRTISRVSPRLRAWALTHSALAARFL